MSDRWKKKRVFLTASQQTIRRCIGKLGWRKIHTKYCQIVSPVNRLKRFVYASMAKITNENFDDVIDLNKEGYFFLSFKLFWYLVTFKKTLY